MNDLLPSVLADCRVLVQGITGREASMVTKHMLDYGTRVVGGVSPGKGGQEVEGVPVYDSVKDAVSAQKPYVSIVYVPPAYVRDAALEAIEEGINLILIITERVPQRDTIELIARARLMGCRIIGPNITGLIRPSQKIKLGPIGGSNPERTFVPGDVAIISRSGGMTSEIAWTLKRDGFGTSMGISIGGDPFVGTTMKEALQLLESDSDSRAVALFCEPGGYMENEVADFCKSGGLTKPLVAYVAGRFTEELPRGVKFGHAGALIHSDYALPSFKINAFRQAGILVAESLYDISKLVKAAIR